MMAGTASSHAEVWLLLPWFANGRLSAAERVGVEEHVHGCPECAQELALQRLMCRALSEPDRVTYAPGPSLRKLMDRIDGRGETERPEDRVRRVRRFPAPTLSAWRPPGLAFAASFLAAIALAAVAATAYRWSQPLYATYTDAARPSPGVLHIAFERSLPVGEVEELLRSAGARVVEGPGATGIFGVTPVAAGPDARAMRALVQRLRADARVRWVEPVGGADAPAAAAQGPSTRDP
jgi:anti-sigma factor RsiW